LDPFAGRGMTKDFVVPDELNCSSNKLKTYTQFRACVKLQHSVIYKPVMQKKDQ